MRLIAIDMGFDVILRHKHTITHGDYKCEVCLRVCLGGANVSWLAQAKLCLVSMDREAPVVSEEVKHDGVWGPPLI